MVQVPAYVSAQVLGSTLASGTLRLLFGGKHEHFPGTIPTGSDVQSLALEFIISFYLMFVVSGVATDNRAVSLLMISISNYAFIVHNNKLHIFQLIIMIDI